MRRSAKTRLNLRADTLRTLSVHEITLVAGGGLTIGSHCDSCGDPRTTCCPLTL